MFNSALSCIRHRSLLALTLSTSPSVSRLANTPFFARKFSHLNVRRDQRAVGYEVPNSLRRSKSTKRVVDEDDEDGGFGLKFFLVSGMVVYLGCLLKKGKLLNLKQLNSKFERFNTWSYNWVLDNVINKLYPLSEEPLLPDFHKLGYPENLPTLVIGLRGTICDYSHSRKNGWGVVKRPGADKFFDTLKHYYEIVIWSDESFPTPHEVVQKWNLPVIGVLDKNQFTKRDGKYFKNLSRLGRNLERVILIDNESDSVSIQRENSIVLPKYEGNPFDNELESIIDLLKAAALQPGDVKLFIKRFDGGNGNIATRFNDYKETVSRKSNNRRKFSKFLPK